MTQISSALDAKVMKSIETRPKMGRFWAVTKDENSEPLHQPKKGQALNIHPFNLILVLTNKDIIPQRNYCREEDNKEHYRHISSHYIKGK